MRDEGETKLNYRRVANRSGVLELVFSNPPVNAHSIGDLNALADLLNGVEADETIAVVILRSEGKGFSAGGDMREMLTLPGHEGIIGQANAGYRASLAIAECAVPVVVAIQGYCIGIGVLLAGAADIVIASEDATFTLAEIDYGATAGAIQAINLMPEKRLRSAMYTGEPVGVAELERFGSIEAVVPADELPAAADRLSARIAAKPVRSIRAMKASIDGSIARRIRDHYRSEISYTYELNMLGIAAAARESFLAVRQTR